MGLGTAGQSPGNKEQVDSKKMQLWGLGGEWGHKVREPHSPADTPGKETDKPVGGGRDQKRKNEGIGF